MIGQIATTLVEHHDLRFVTLAGTICILSAFACISILTHARRADGPWRLIWAGVAAVSVGFGVWATHFIAMLAFDVGIPAGYDPTLTVGSLIIAILVCGGGLLVATLGNRPSDLLLGGAIVGIGISAMHFVGMNALLVGGKIAWDPTLVSISILTGIGFGAAALRIGAVGKRVVRRWAGAGLLTLAVCSMHFTAMAASNFENCYAIVTNSALRGSTLSLAVGFASIFILLLALGGLYLNVRDRRRALEEVDRMRGLADAAVEGLIVCDGDTIVTFNAAFGRIVGLPAGKPATKPLSHYLDEPSWLALTESPETAIETEIHSAGGEVIPVEAVLRTVDYAGRPHQAIALRDLRARKEAERHIRFLAHHDAMTGLPNRTSFHARINTELAPRDGAPRRFAIMCLDLDRFKDVNDLFGHAAGDALLQRVADAISTAIGRTGFAARLGGDEFAVIVPGVSNTGQATTMARAVLEGLAAANEDAGTSGVASASIGIAFFPEHGTDQQALMTHADTALYAAKAEGPGSFRIFEPEMGAIALDRRQTEHDLRHAVAREEFFLVYQPQSELASGTITGFEALVRWNHPKRGQVSPARFIPLAEESGLIMAIGEWVLVTACREAASWDRPLSVAVNVSPVQLHAPHFATLVEETLLATGLDPARLEIEITETALTRNMTRALSTLRRIKALGVRIAMDDFGTGYSSLANLRAFPFDKIKVDQSFVRQVHDNPQSAAIVRAVLGLGKGMGLPVLAEGVENDDELAFLIAEVCDAAQGYLLGRPEPISDYRALTHEPEDNKVSLRSRRTA
ncbi:EAL domain-containing protein [Pelagibacterium montanilacus]|uniref:EAL domain-containing protein n=1 Tax=Pelagibacterium montanilacus TaxID=2185280 RepID=UPI000F8DB973|nr:EAL domain-containing protein [Pelagibacterium montanilacus]